MALAAELRAWVEQTRDQGFQVAPQEPRLPPGPLAGEPEPQARSAGAGPERGAAPRSEDPRARLDPVSRVAAGAPVEPARAAPVEPARAAPAEPARAAPVEPARAAPVEPARQRPGPSPVVPPGASPPPPPLRAAAWAERAAQSSPPSGPAPHADAWAQLAEQSRTPPAPPGTLEAIRAELGDCRRCPLAQSRQHIVFGEGAPRAELVVLGEGPGAQEDATGSPFVGPAGQMLDKMLLNVLHLRREQVYILNVVKCRPPDNRNPSPAEVAACLPFAERQLRSIQPKIILLMGSVALQSLLGVTGITRRRGVWTEWQGIPVMPTFHPAYLLRKPEDKKLVHEDLKAVATRLRGA
ncbi:MAG: uracil-DNA glycosylase [Deltaproteobacteria bacterium]|nr:uracil-DNA glycosylase [Deltaproteobacteria bacterium]